MCATIKIMEDDPILFNEHLRHAIDVFDGRLERIELNQEHLWGRWWGSEKWAVDVNCQVLKNVYRKY